MKRRAWMDGAGPIRTFNPHSAAILRCCNSYGHVFSLIWHWNDYFLSSMYLTDGYPLAVWLTMMPKQLPTMGYSLVPSHRETMAVLMAGCLVFNTADAYNLYIRSAVVYRKHRPRRYYGLNFVTKGQRP